MFDLTKTKAVLWDLDDTLYSRTEAARRAFPGMLKELLYIDRSDEFIKEAVDFVLSKAYRSSVTSEDAFSVLVEKYPTDKPYVHSDIVDYYFDHIGEYAEVYPEQLAVLKKLREIGVKTAMVTNISSERAYAQWKKIDNIGVKALFDTIIFSGDVGIHKPDRRIFDHAAELLGVSNDQCVFVGDDPTVDVEGALNADMEVVWIDNWPYDGRFDKEPKVHRVKSVLEYFVF